MNCCNFNYISRFVQLLTPIIIGRIAANLMRTKTLSKQHLNIVVWRAWCSVAIISSVKNQHIFRDQDILSIKLQENFILVSIGKIQNASEQICLLVYIRCCTLGMFKWWWVLNNSRTEKIEEKKTWWITTNWNNPNFINCSTSGTQSFTEGNKHQ